MPGSTPGVYVCVLNNYPYQVGTFLVHMDYAAGWNSENNGYNVNYNSWYAFALL